MRTAFFGLVALALLSTQTATAQGIRWASSYDEALREAKERGVLILCVLATNGEQANEDMMAIYARSKSVHRACGKFVCLFANPQRHSEVSRKVDGETRAVCPITGNLPCKAHTAIEKVLVPKFAQVMIDPQGNVRTPVAWIVDGNEKVIEIIANGDRTVGFDPVPEPELVARLNAAAQKYGPGLSAEQYHKLRSLLDEGKALEEKGDFTGAAAKYEEVVRTSPKKVGSVDEAQARLAAIAKRAEGKLAEAEDLAGKGEYAAAMAILEEVREGYKHTPAEARADALLAEIRKNPEVAKLIAGEKEERAAAKKLASAQKLETSKRFKKALDAYEECAAKYPNTPSGRAAKKRLEEMKADETIMAQVAEEQAKKDCTKWLTLAKNFMNMNMPDRAREYLEKVIATYPGTSYAAEAGKLLAGLD